MTPVGMFYRRVRSRIGGLGAVKATAHKLACLVYTMLNYGQEYVVQSMEEYEVKMKVNMVRALQRKAAVLGFQLKSDTNAIAGSIEAVAIALQACHYAQRRETHSSRICCYRRRGGNLRIVYYGIQQ